MRFRPPKIGEGLNDDSLAGEYREAFRTVAFHERLHRYGNARSNALQFRRYLVAQREDKLADAIGECGNYLTFREYFTIGETRLAKICTCKKHLICPLCAIRRGATAVRVNLEKVEELRKIDPLLKAYLVTFTVKNGDDLSERYRHLSSNLRLLHRRRSRQNIQSEVLKASAAVWSYEFTNRGKGWHPHAHAIWLCREAPDAFKLSKEWHVITGDSFIVDVTPMDESDPVGAFLEVFKYALKFSDLADAERLHAYKTLKGKRLQGSFGQLRGLDIEPKDSDVLLEDLPFIERMFSFINGVGYVETGTTGEVQKHAA